MRLYWLTLTHVVDATGAWPDAEALHEELVFECGFRRAVLNPFTGLYAERRDSISFESMDQDRMNVFMTTALARLSEALGIDALDLLPPEPAR